MKLQYDQEENNNLKSNNSALGMLAQPSTNTNPFNSNLNKEIEKN